MIKHLNLNLEPQCCTFWCFPFSTHQLIKSPNQTEPGDPEEGKHQYVQAGGTPGPGSRYTAVE